MTTLQFYIFAGLLSLIAGAGGAVFMGLVFGGIGI
jgi:hypothetical protein